MLGNPKFNYGDKVKFKYIPYQKTEEVEVIGEIYIIDAYGTFEQNKEVSYDVMFTDDDGYKCLFKHLVESRLESV